MALDVAPPTSPLIRPRVRVLGDVLIDGTRGERPPLARRVREIVTYLALSPGGSEAAFNEAIFPGQVSGEKVRKNRNEYMRLARKWVGRDEDGHPFVCLVPDGGYALSGVSVDWTIFQQLVGDDVTSTPTEDLREALALVRGRPLSGLEEQRWEWAMTLKTVMSEAVVEVSREMVTRSLEAADFGTAATAAEIGVMVAPWDQRLWDAAETVAHATGGRGARDELRRRAGRAMEGLD